MLRPGCALPFTSGPQTRSLILQSATETNSFQLESTVPIAHFVGVDGRARAARNRTHYRAFFTANQAAEWCTTKSASRSGDLVPMLIPDRTLATITIIIRI